VSDVNETVGCRRRRMWTLRGAALAVALAVAVPAWAQSAEDLNSAELGRLNTAASVQPAPMAVTPQPTVPTAFSAPSYAAQSNAYPADIDCNNPYYASYCLAYANWLNQYYAAYGYGYYPYLYDYWDYGYVYPVDVAFGFGFFAGHRFHNFHHFAFAHGIGFHGRGFHAGGFHGGGFHGGGFHGGGGGHR
jgi:hypothetical protein